MARRILLIGGTGLVGALLAERLRSDDDFQAEFWSAALRPGRPGRP
jgi:uncharacterized protein YbjT (DUF2867 family)